MNKKEITRIIQLGTPKEFEKLMDQLFPPRTFIQKLRRFFTVLMWGEKAGLGHKLWY